MGLPALTGGCTRFLVGPGAGMAQDNLLRGWGQCIFSALAFARSAEGVWSR